MSYDVRWIGCSGHERVCARVRDHLFVHFARITWGGAIRRRVAPYEFSVLNSCSLPLPAPVAPHFAMLVLPGEFVCVIAFKKKLSLLTRRYSFGRDTTFVLYIFSDKINFEFRILDSIDSDRL